MAEKQALKTGFSLEDGMWLVTEFKWYDFKKGERRNHVRILSVTYEGVLTVTDEELLKVALTNGIGREKAYGLGMLTIVGVDNRHNKMDREARSPCTAHNKRQNDVYLS